MRASWGRWTGLEGKSREMSDHVPHSIRCSGYRGVGKEFDTEDCDCGWHDRCRIKKLETALRDIIAHQEAIGGGLAVLSATRRIALEALGQENT